MIQDVVNKVYNDTRYYELVNVRNISLECGLIYQLLRPRSHCLWGHRRHTGRQSFSDEVAGRECHKHHIKDVRFINRWLLFRVKPALGLVPLGVGLPALSPLFSFFPVAIQRCYACTSTVYTRVD